MRSCLLKGITYGLLFEAVTFLSTLIMWRVL